MAEPINFHAKTKAAMCAVQDQALAANVVCKRIYIQDVKQICQLCFKENETISYVVSGYKLFAATKYTEEHNTIYQYLHLCMLQDLKLLVHPK
eukprot:1135128-Ditylum_brightwellii.AAC.1